MASPTSPNTFLTRKQAVDYLQRRGVQISYGYLANMANNNNSGGGPSFYKDGGRALYTRDDLEEWRRKRLRRVE